MTNFPTYNFNGSRVLITGGTSGIGRATARAFANSGAKVCINGRDQSRGESICQDFPEQMYFIPGDITESSNCENIVESAVEKLGGLDIVVNSAGVIYHATAEETTDHQWLNTFAVNVHGMFFICRAALPHLKKNKGSILNIASDAGLGGSYHMTAYCASKGAVVQMCRSMSKDYGKYGVRILPICPGDVDTEMLRGEFEDRGLTAEQGLKESAESVPINKVCSPEEIASLVLYCATDAAGFMTGQPVIIDGGNRA